MKYTMYHTNITVLDYEKSLNFYKEALELEVLKTVDAEDGSWKIAFLGHPDVPCKLEITWYAERKEPWNLGDNEVHVGFAVEDYEAALAKHKEMGCVCFENTDMGIYFIEDPDGYWMEVVPAHKAD